MRFDKITTISHHRENLEIKSSATNRNEYICVSLKKADSFVRTVLCFVVLESEIEGFTKELHYIIYGHKCGAYHQTPIPRDSHSDSILLIVGWRRKRKEERGIFEKGIRMGVEKEATYLYFLHNYTTRTINMIYMIYSQSV